MVGRAGTAGRAGRRRRARRRRSRGCRRRSAGTSGTSESSGTSGIGFRADRAGAATVPLRTYRPMCCTFQRAGSCSVWVRALRQCRWRLSWSRLERVPPSSNTAPATSTATGVDVRLAAATATDAAPADSSVRSVARLVHRKARGDEQGLGRAHLDGQLADALDQQGVLGRGLDAALEPGPGAAAHEGRPPRPARPRRCRRRSRRAATGRARRAAADPGRSGGAGRCGPRVPARPAGARCRWRWCAAPCRPSRRPRSAPVRPGTRRPRAGCRRRTWASTGIQSANSAPVL